MSARVSVLVSAYQTGEFLPRRLYNLLMQGEQAEIVCIYQYGSAEEQTIRDFERLNRGLLAAPVIHVGTEGVPGLYEAWNLGVDYSHGKFLTAGNADDLHTPAGLRVLADALDADGEAMLAYGQVLTLQQGVLRAAKTVTDGASLRDFCYVGTMPMWRREAHHRLGKFDVSYQVYGDYEMWSRMERAGCRFARVEGVVGIYNRRAESLGHARPEINRAELEKIRAGFDAR